MAFELPGAIGAQLAYPDRQIVSVGGDGGFTMLCADFLTAVKYKLPITCVVFNNGKLGLIEIEEEKAGLPRYAVDLQPFDFAGFAAVCGGRGWRVDNAAGLDTALAEAYAHAGPAIVDVVIDPDILPLPPRITLSQAVGFGTAKVKELFSKDEA
jgi:thiamine pyrophosphate-dependent acetolactate synthase large subunit-like protein